MKDMTLEEWIAERNAMRGNPQVIEAAVKAGELCTCECGCAPGQPDFGRCGCSTDCRCKTFGHCEIVGPAAPPRS